MFITSRISYFAYIRCSVCLSITREICGLLTPRGRSCNGRHERVSHRIGVIVDSNDTV